MATIVSNLVPMNYSRRTWSNVEQNRACQHVVKTMPISKSAMLSITVIDRLGLAISIGFISSVLFLGLLKSMTALTIIEQPSLNERISSTKAHPSIPISKRVFRATVLFHSMLQTINIQP